MYNLNFYWGKGFYSIFLMAQRCPCHGLIYMLNFVQCSDNSAKVPL